MVLPLPRAVERQTGGRWKHYIGQIVFLAFSKDEQAMGFGFPKEQRDDLVDSAPDTFFLPRPQDLRFNWVCARLAPLDDDEMRELVTDAWRMCVPRMLHELPDLPPPTAQAWSLIDAARWLVRVIVSLLTVPGGDDAAERRLVERFVAPVVAPATTRSSTQSRTQR